MTDEINPYLERLVSAADAAETADAARFRASRAMIGNGSREQDVFIRSAMVLNLLANGREEYANKAPDGVRENLQREVAAYRVAARVLAGDGLSARGALPPWLLDDFRTEAAALGLNLDHLD